MDRIVVDVRLVSRDSDGDDCACFMLAAGRAFANGAIERRDPNANLIELLLNFPADARREWIFIGGSQ
ncbi:hypothetical protein [Nocardia carnea]|uniref:hypothetical protein n=1 Tax=Nocardia carnea TaxID=37328 RepID=UPI0024539775|nr:hypothetical protein [Nocardia carnea]